MFAHRAPQGVDGVLLVIDPRQGEQGERELEALYLHFAQPAGLTTKQCMVVAVNAGSGAAAVGGNAAWAGERVAEVVRGHAARSADPQVCSCAHPECHAVCAQMLFHCATGLTCRRLNPLFTPCSHSLIPKNICRPARQAWAAAERVCQHQRGRP